MTSTSRTHPVLVTTAHIDELREKCESLASEAKDGAVVESKAFTQALVDEHAEAVQRRLEEQLSALAERLDAGLAEVRARLEAVGGRFVGLAREADVEALEARLSGGLSEARAATAREAEAVASLGRELGALREEGARAGDSLAASISARQREEGERRAADLESLRRSARGDLDEQVRGLEGAIARARGDLSARLEALEEEQLEALERYFSTVAGRLQALEAATRSIESLPTRRVEWRIPGASQLDGPRAERGGPRSWWSPRFMVGGQGEMQLELRLFREAEAGGGCALQLWCCEGCRGFEAVVRLYVGTSVEELHHDFAAGRFCAMRRCPWRGAVDPADDTLRVGVELVEGFQLLSGARAEPAPPHPEGTAGPPPAGALGIYRHLCPSTADRVARLQEQWDGLRSRMVGRVEWRLEQVLMLQHCFPKGECLCSTMFSAGGFEHLQLVFYPSGDDDARQCYCSLFLFCPGHPALQCWLSVGKQRREAHRHRCKPDFVGRSNFCLFDSAADRASDTLTLVLEVAEAQQHNGDASKPAARAVPWPALASSALDAAPGQDASAPSTYEDVVQSSSRLQGLPGRISLEDVKQLPALWTSKPGGDAAGGDAAGGDAAAGAAAAGHLPPVWSYRPPRQAGRGGSLPEGYLRLSELPGVPPVQGARRSRVRDAHTPRSARSSPAPKGLQAGAAARPGAGGRAGTPPSTLCSAGAP